MSEKNDSKLQVQLPMHGKMSRNIEDSSCLTETLKDFTTKCTIVGLSQVANRRSWILRVMWAFIACGGLGIAVWQTWGVITEYCEHKVIMKSEWRSAGLQLLPTITICAFQATENDSYERAADKYVSEWYWIPRKLQLENKTDKFLDTFQAAVDWNGALYVVDRLHLKFSKDENEQCFTFNSAINSTQWIRSPPYTGVTLYVFRNNTSPDADKKSAMVMHMSTPGVAPTCESGDGSAITLEMGNYYIASIEWEEITRIPNRGSSCDCVSSDGEYQYQSLYYSEEQPYKYSIEVFEACTKSMMQNMSLHFCNCYIPTIPISYLVHEYPEARPCETTCAHVLNMTNIFEECGVPCWEMSFRTTIQKTPLLFFQNDLLKDMKILQDRVNYSMAYPTYDAYHPTYDPKSSKSAPNLNDISYGMPNTEPQEAGPEAYSPSRNESHDSGREPGPTLTPIAGHYNPPMHIGWHDRPTPEESKVHPNPYSASYFTPEHEYSDAFLKQESVMIKVQVQSPMMSVFYETPKYSLSDFWGVIGGNLGLWLGVSAVSIAELVELFLIICGQLFKKLTRSDEVSPQKPKQFIVHVMQAPENSK